MSDLLYRIQSRLGDDAAVLWDTVAGTLDPDRPDWALAGVGPLALDGKLPAVMALGRYVAVWCANTRLWAVRVGFSDAAGPFEDNSSWVDRVMRLDRDTPTTEAG